MQRNELYAEKLAELIRIETISEVGSPNRDKFRAFHKALREMFPTLFSKVTVEDFDGSLLIRWQGKDPAARPILLMSHHDVVEATGEWSHEPFAGEIAEGKLWGRGTLDTKGSLWAMLTAADELAQEGFVPSCDVCTSRRPARRKQRAWARTLFPVRLQSGALSLLSLWTRAER